MGSTLLLDLILLGCESVVDLADGLHWHLVCSEVPSWWIWGLYVPFLLFLTHRSLWPRWRWALAGASSWLLVGLVGAASPLQHDELRCTFLAVGHGGCTVIETPDGRVLLYDAGTMAGPEFALRHIAP